MENEKRKTKNGNLKLKQRSEKKKFELAAMETPHQGRSQAGVRV